MVKMESPNRKGQFKMFDESSVEAAKANGWKEVGASKPTPAKKKKVVKKKK